MRLKNFHPIRKMIFPNRCPGCREVLDIGQEGFCRVCQKSLKVVSEPVCECCGKLIQSDKGQYCTDCARMKHSFIQNKSLYVYEGSARQAMYNLKYNNDKWIAGYLAGELYSRYARWIEICGIEAVIPVPMYNKKERERGYNQAEVIAHHLARLVGQRGNNRKIPVVAAVKRIKNTIPQKELSVSVRRKNVKRAFKLDRNVVESYDIYTRGRLTAFGRVLIVDDIYTTGSTIDAVSDLCLAGGIAGEVYSMTAVVGRGNTETGGALWK